MTGFTYCPEQRLLVFPASDDHEHRYRVKHIRKDLYWLYHLEDVEIEPDDYYFKLKVRVEKKCCSPAGARLFCFSRKKQR